jgi:hypothetical protein
VAPASRTYASACPPRRFSAHLHKAVEAPTPGPRALPTIGRKRNIDQPRSQSSTHDRILSDIDGGYALELNLLFRVGDEKREAMRASGFDIAPYQSNESWMLPIPATFVVGRDGLVKARHIDPDYRHRMETDDLLAALKS